MDWSFWFVMSLSLFLISKMLFDIFGFVPSALVLGIITLTGTPMPTTHQWALFVVLGVVIRMLISKLEYGEIFQFRDAVFEAYIGTAELAIFAIFSLVTWAVIGIFLPTKIAMYVGLFGMPAVFYGAAIFRPRDITVGRC